MKKQPVYAIVRIDNYESPNIEVRMTIVRIVRTMERAVSEVERLNQLNGDKGCKYYWQYTRLEVEDNEATILKLL